MPTPEELADYAERLHAWARDRIFTARERRAEERARLFGHSACEAKHDHYRAGCCPRCTERWGDLPADAPGVPFEAFSDHEKANYTPEDWARVAQIEDEQNAYVVAWTPATCRHEFCAITDDNREICEWCGDDVTDPDFPIEQIEVARERAADYDRRSQEIAERAKGEANETGDAPSGPKGRKAKVMAYQSAPEDGKDLPN
jgi:hypothetical protein